MSREAVAQAEEVLDQIIDVQERFDQAVPIETLIESGHNARRKFDPTKLQELADSIRQHGVIEPLIARPFELFGEPRLEIVAGARRARAAKLAGRTHVPVLIRDYSDNDVLELHIVENLQREGLDPLDEAASYKALIESDKDRYSAAYIAQRIGRKEAYVWETIRLLNLIPEAQQLLEAGRITRSHGEAIARLTPAQQANLVVPDGALWVHESARLGFDEGAAITDEYAGLKPISIRELESHIAHHVRLDVKHAAEIAPLEFAETASRVEMAMAKPGRGKKVISITHLEFVPADARDENERTFTGHNWKRADGKDDSKTCEYSVLGVIAVGEGQGEAFDVCIAKEKCDTHWKSERLAKAKVKKLNDSGQADKAREVFERQRETQAEEQRKQLESKTLWDAARTSILDALAKSLKKAKPGALAVLVTDGCDYSHDQRFLKLARARIPAKHKADDILRQAALIVLSRGLFDYNAHDGRFARVARQFGVDVKEILKTIPKQPRSKEAQ